MNTFFTCILVLLFSVSSRAQDLYSEKYRPSFHFSPAQHWINDPNGLVYYAGEYHMFYQYNPFGDVWGHMHWGHAISKDLVHWQELPIAIPEDGNLMIFSGSVVIDDKNTSGFGSNKNEIPMVAIYTGHIEKVSQSQHLAYSLDKGRTWKNYSGNPVLDIGSKDFRDPKVFWYAPENKWVMSVALALEKKIQFYQSKNLKEWSLLSSFGPVGDTSGIWECPDLFQVPVAGSSGQKKWVLMHSPAPYMQYFVGEFDGTNFKSENPASVIYRPDYGPDYYAAIMFNGLPPSMLPVGIGWVNNWTYANEIPTKPWRGAMSLSRTMQVKKIGEEWILYQLPMQRYNELQYDGKSWKNISVNEKWSVPGTETAAYASEIIIDPNQRKDITIDIAGGALLLTYDDSASVFILKRGGNNVFQNAEFDKRSEYSAKIRRTNNPLRIKLYFDHSIAEAYVNDGEVVMTAQIFPQKENLPMVIKSTKGATIPSIKCWKMHSIWKNKN